MLESPELASLAAVLNTCLQHLPGDAFWLVMEVSKTSLSGGVTATVADDYAREW